MPSNTFGSYTSIEPYVYVNMGLQDRHTSIPEADAAINSACTRLRSRHYYRSNNSECDALYHMDVYTVVNTAFQNSPIVARTSHAAYDICSHNGDVPYEAPYSLNSFSGITRQNVRLREYNRMAYDTQQAFLFAAHNDRRHVFNLLNAMYDQDLAHDTASSVLTTHQNMLHVMGSQSHENDLPYTYALTPFMRRAYTTTVYVGSDCDSVCAYATLSDQTSLPKSEELNVRCINATRNYVISGLTTTTSAPYALSTAGVDVAGESLMSLPATMMIGLIFPLSIISFVVCAITSGLSYYVSHRVPLMLRERIDGAEKDELYDDVVVKGIVHKPVDTDVNPILPPRPEDLYTTNEDAMSSEKKHEQESVNDALISKTDLQ